MGVEQGFVQFVIDQIDADCEMTFRHMFGGTTLYSKGKVVALICDNQLFVKPTDAGKEFAGKVAEAPPYTGAKPFLLIEDQLENRVWLTQLIRVTESVLPKPKKKK